VGVFHNISLCDSVNTFLLLAYQAYPARHPYGWLGFQGAHPC